MNDKDHNIRSLQDVFFRWRESLTQLTEDQISTIQLSPNRTIKDVVDHLRAWQEVSIARLQAALTGTQPILPDWLTGEDPEDDEGTSSFNDRIYRIYLDRDWIDVEQIWLAGFSKFIELAEMIPESDFTVVGKYAWMKGYTLLAVLQGSLEHHEEHLDGLLASLQEQEK